MVDAPSDSGSGHKALELVRWILDKAVDGVPPLVGARELAAQYAADAAYRTPEDRVKALMRWESTKNFASGFATGLGGLLALPFSIPAALGASWVLQARLAAATAALYGYSLKDDRVRTMVLLAILGDSAKSVAKTATIAVGERLTMNVIRGIPGRALIELNKRVGLRLLTKAGETGVVNLAKAVPLVGGVVGGSVDAALCMAVGRAAQRVFAPAVTVVDGVEVRQRRRTTQQPPKPKAARAPRSAKPTKPSRSMSSRAKLPTSSKATLSKPTKANAWKRAKPSTRRKP